jgi:hypothetical protein
MQREKTILARGRPKGVCRSPHAWPRPAIARGVCQSCANAAYAKIRRKECTDQELVDKGYWAPKGYTIVEHIEDLMKA